VDSLKEHRRTILEVHVGFCKIAGTWHTVYYLRLIDGKRAKGRPRRGWTDDVKD